MQDLFPGETIAVSTATLEKRQMEKEPNPFYPNGAIAFFIVLVLLCLVIWFGIYYIMLQRI